MQKLIAIKNLISRAIFDTVIKDYPVTNNKAHVNNAIQWLAMAQDSHADGGVSEGYHLYHGWLPPYPETTGYIIETLFDYYHYIVKDENIKSRAVQLADWLLSIQNSDGSIPDSYFRKKMVFDTGQVIFGFVRTYNETQNEKYKNAAIMAADWLVSQQETTGEWIQHAAANIPHTYYSRVAWSLLEVHRITLDDRYKESCIRNIEWCMSQQDEKGWFNHASFNLQNHHRPFTHTIAYTMRGILESGFYLKKQKYIDAVRLSADNLVDKIPKSGFVCGTYGKNWSGDNKFSCLTGNMQLAIILNKLHIETGDMKYHQIAESINNYTKGKQVLGSSNKNINGAIAGSFPIWGNYIHYCYPNWAVKFFVESLILELKIKKLI